MLEYTIPSAVKNSRDWLYRILEGDMTAQNVNIPISATTGEKGAKPSETDTPRTELVTWALQTKKYIYIYVISSWNIYPKSECALNKNKCFNMQPSHYSCTQVAKH
jgi:hypothetical protein